MYRNHEKGYLAKQGISYADHMANMAALSEIDKMHFETIYNFDLPIEDLIASEKKTLDWLLTLDNAEISIKRVRGNIAYLTSLGLKQLTLEGVA